MDKRLILILGGARSGKSAFAQRLAGRLGQRVLYVATAQAGDEEMAQRIATHRANRPPTWRTLEAPSEVGEAIRRACGDAEVVLLDCLTLLVSNRLLEAGEDAPQEAQARVETEVENLLACHRQMPAHLIVVANEVGLGLVPPYPIGRLFRDVHGWVNQWVAREADQVYLVVVGLPIELKALQAALDFVW